MATELVPPLIGGSDVTSILVGFAIGVAAMLGIRAVSGEVDGTDGQSDHRGFGGLVAVVGVDLFVDGLLVALAMGAGERGGLVLAAGISFETLFLGLALAATLAGRRRLLMATALGSAGLLIVGGVSGLLLFGWLTDPWRLGLLAFGTAALLYLVTEELLVEAHRGRSEGSLTTAMFFVGFGSTLGIAAVSG